MRNPRTTNSYLLETTSGYVFRYCIPKNLKSVVGKSEFRYSLKTGQLGLAKRRARHMASYVQVMIANIQWGGTVSKLSADMINGLINKYIRDFLEADEKSRIMQDGPLGDGLYDDQLKAYDFLQDTFRHDLAHCDISNISKHVDKFVLQANEIEADKESMEYKKLCREILKVQVRLTEIAKERELGNYSSGIKYRPEPKATITQPQAEPETQQGERISEIIEMYVAESEKAGTWTEKTKSEIESILNLFKKIVGDTPARVIDKSEMRKYKQILMQLPPNMNKVKKYRNKSIDELLEMKIDKTLSASTINKQLVKVSTFFNYAVDNGFLTANPARGMQLPKQNRDDELREIFDQEDLMKLFYSKEYRNDKHRTAYAFWVPIIALYIGCRLEEICQLHLEDIRNEDNTWVIDINNKGEKKVKSNAARRLVPIHPFIADDLGFVGYVDFLRAREETRLFPELNHQRDGYGQAVSKWFARYKKRCGIEGKKKAFHSFRHTFITNLKHKHVDPYMLHEIDGHAIDSMTMGRYGKRFLPSELYQSAISKLDYGIDLNHLKNSKYVRKD